MAEWKGGTYKRVRDNSWRTPKGTKTRPPGAIRRSSGYKGGIHGFEAPKRHYFGSDDKIFKGKAATAWAARRADFARQAQREMLARKIRR